MNFIATIYKEDDNLRILFIENIWKKKKAFELGLYYCYSMQHLAHLIDGTKNITSFPKKQHSWLLFIIEYSSKNWYGNKLEMI